MGSEKHELRNLMSFISVPHQSKARIQLPNTVTVVVIDNNFLPILLLFRDTAGFLFRTAAHHYCTVI